MAEEKGKKITDLAEEPQLDDTDLILLGTNGTSALRKATLGALKAWVLSLVGQMVVPPVGWIEYNESGVNPAERYPGTVWELAGKGAVAVCIDTADSTLKNAGAVVGSNSVKLEAKHLPKHTHDIGKHQHRTAASEVITTQPAGHHSHYGYYKKLAASGSAVSVYQTRIDSSYNVSPREFVVPVDDHTHKLTIPELITGDTLSGQTGENASGSATAISTMQKSYVVYRWKRTR